eukprot:7385130-Prymnesium_polylepis.1
MWPRLPRSRGADASAPPRRQIIRRRRHPHRRAAGGDGRRARAAARRDPQGARLFTWVQLEGPRPHIARVPALNMAGGAGRQPGGRRAVLADGCDWSAHDHAAEQLRQERGRCTPRALVPRWQGAQGARRGRRRRGRRRCDRSSWRARQGRVGRPHRAERAE